MLIPVPKQRIFVVGDIHGELTMLKTLMQEIKPNEDDVLIFLGDYIDRGADSFGVIDYLINLKHVLKDSVVCLMGNHEQMLVLSHKNNDSKGYWSRQWAANGAKSTIESYKKNGFKKIPKEHLDFFDSLPLYYVMNNVVFCHATPGQFQDIEHNEDNSLLWGRPSKKIFEYGYRHVSGQKVVCGHTDIGEAPVMLGNLLMIDTGCGKGGILTAVEIKQMLCYQINSQLAISAFNLPQHSFLITH